MAVNLQDGYWLPTGWTAMTQMYGPVQVGDTLHAIDTLGQPLTQPFSTPGNFKVVALIEDASLGAKFAIYKDEVTNRVMPVAMGTNGWGDGQGWYANFVNVGLVQWRVPTVKAKLFEALNAVVDANTQVVFTGDSKGGALVQFMIYDL